MKLKLLRLNNKMYMYCQNGSIIHVQKEDLKNLLVSFEKPNLFKGNDGYWPKEFASIEEIRGELLAYVDDSNKLIVLNQDTFKCLVEPNIEYISATEYAQMHGKSRASIKNMCMAGRLEGAYKTSIGWMIPKSAPYPERKQRTIKND